MGVLKCPRGLRATGTSVKAGVPAGDDRRPLRGERWRLPVRTLSGWTLIALGVTALAVPLMPTLPLVLAGAALLGSEHWLVRKVTGRLAAWRARARKTGR